MGWSAVTPHSMFTEKERCYLLSTVPCGLLRSHKRDLLLLLTPLRGKWVCTLNKILWIICGLELIQRHNSNRLYMSADEHVRTTTANSQRCKQHQHRCRAS